MELVEIKDLEVGDEILISCQSYFKYLRILRNKIDAITDDILRSGYTNATTAEVMEENKGK